jgi:hypothetical protein
MAASGSGVFDLIDGVEKLCRNGGDLCLTVPFFDDIGSIFFSLPIFTNFSIFPHKCLRET